MGILTREKKKEDKTRQRAEETSFNLLRISLL